MYLHYIMTSPKNEMLYRVFKAMMRNPSKGDWIELVQKDLIDYEIGESFEQIGKIKAETFKKKVKKAGRKYSFNKLITEKLKHKKGNLLKYSELKIQNYLISDNFTTKESKFLFKIRTHMLNVKANFKEKYKNDSQSEEEYLRCDLCSKHIDNQENLLICESLDISENIEYKDMFSTNVKIAAVATRKYRKLWRQREKEG